MRTIYELLLITGIVTFGIDVAGFVESVKQGLTRWLGVRVRSLKPFDCSLCSTWWCCLLWLICTRQFTLEGVALSAGCALMAKPIGQLMEDARYIVETAAHVIQGLLDKIWKI